MQQMRMPIQLTSMVKKLIAINVVIWVVGVLVIQNLFLSTPYLYQYFALTPWRVITDFWVWQPLTYMFLHDTNVFHVFFNMLLLWWFGSELENRWGSRFFLKYYLISGVGAGIIYLIGVSLYYLVTDKTLPMNVPVVGASGAIFGILLAYGLIFGEKIIYFMMIFPMKAKFFVLIIGLIEAMTLLSDGFTSRVANLCHLGGILSGYLYLYFHSRIKPKMSKMRENRKRRLKLVVDNEAKTNKPRYWN